jgi:hypothetical protein
MSGENRSAAQEETGVIIPAPPESDEVIIAQAADENLIKIFDEADEEESETSEEVEDFSVKVNSIPIQRVRIGRKEKFFFSLTCNGVELTKRIPIRVQWDAHLRIDVKPHREMAFNGCSIFNTPVRSISREPVKTHKFEMMNGNRSEISRIEWDFRE